MATVTPLCRAVISRISHFNNNWLKIHLTRWNNGHARNCCHKAIVLRQTTLVSSQKKTNPRAAEQASIIKVTSFANSTATTQTDPIFTSVFQHVERLDLHRELRVKWGDGFENSYPYIWLRDNCFCPSCYQANAQARLVMVEDLDIDIAPIDTSLSSDGQNLTIHWSDGHQSNFTSEFLRGIEFKEKSPKKNVRLWGSELLKDVPTFPFQNLMTDDWMLLQCLETLRDVGLMVIKNAPVETGQLKKMAERISFLRTTSYGVEFTVKSKYEPSNLAYTGAKLGLHTDLPFYEYMPSIQFLHCIKQCAGEGGESTFSDGFKCALQLKQEDPEAFDILSNTYIDFIDIGTDYIPYYTKSAQTVFKFDRFGDICMVRYNNGVRDINIPIPREKVYKYYKALKAYGSILTSPENLVNFKMRDGDMVVFNNTRVLHGRAAFSVSVAGSRHLEGGYIDLDDVHSRIRVLRQNFGLPIPN